MKFPSIEHLPWSQQLSRDDKRKENVKCFEDKSLVFTEKLDGENTAIAKNYIHARSDNAAAYGKPWQTYIIKMAEKFQYDLPDDMIIYGENMYAIHSITYEKLTSYFYVFAIRRGDVFVSTDEMYDITNELKLYTAPIITLGDIDSRYEMHIPRESLYGSVCEGYVVRNKAAFPVSEFNDNIAKCVRANHVQTDIHWKSKWEKAKLIREVDI